MIQFFRHKGVAGLFETDSVADIAPTQAKRLRMQLAALDIATTIQDMDIPGFRLHQCACPIIRGRSENDWI
ncbi:MAG: hypothetical protein EA399_06675 [Desulfovibrionales bacterium]|nr:MAG: hypothetical protein EA399_06675 [Desulfovibrionales bacterium]